MTAAHQTALAEQPRIILETDLHNDCGLVAAAAYSYLSRHGVKARVLVYGYGKDKGHRVVVFEGGGAMCVYDENGTRTIHHSTWKTSPKAFAKALMKACRDKGKLTHARWE